MPSFAFAVPGAVFSRQLVESVGELLKPYSLDSLARSRDEYRSWKNPETRPVDVSEDSVDGSVKEYEDLIQAGGRYEFGSTTLTDERGIVRSSSYTRPSPDLFDTAVSADVTMYVPSWEETAVQILADAASIEVRVTASDEQVEEIASGLQELVNAAIDPARLATILPPFKVFIGHGGDRKWEAVRDYIKPEHDIEAFESDDRVGRATLEVVENMISESSVAVIVMTGVDRLEDGRMLARQNVVHELGFAHGRLGARDTIILLEDGTEEPSNIASINQIRFRSGEIHTTRDEVLAALANRKRDRAART